MPRHVTQRGNRRRQMFFNDDDYAAYRKLMAEACRQRGVEIWAYWLRGVLSRMTEARSDLPPIVTKGRKVSFVMGARVEYLFVPSTGRLYLAVPHRGAQKAEIRAYERSK